MLKNFKYKFRKNIEIFGLIFLILFASIITSYFNYLKKNKNEIYNGFIDNIYLKKTLNHIV